MSVEDACDQLVAARVVVEHPGRQADGRIRNPVQRLRASPHLVGRSRALRIEEVQLLVRVSLVG